MPFDTIGAFSVIFLYSVVCPFTKQTSSKIISSYNFAPFIFFNNTSTNVSASSFIGCET